MAEKDSRPLFAFSAINSLFHALRPSQWTKNLIIFAALIFGQRLFVPAAALRAIGVFFAFCALSSAIYLINDVIDREQDRLHPVKRTRAIASGRVSVEVALFVAAVLATITLGWSFWVSSRLGLIALSYLVLLTLYSLMLKHIVILDVLAIAMGFELRAVAGGVAADVPVSQWLLVCTILLALFLALSKRRYELLLLAEDAAGHRRILGEYSPYLLDQMIGIVTATTLMSYILYTIDAGTAARLGTRWLELTIPFPLYGIFRYLYLVHQKGGGAPANLFLTDRPLLACVGVWAIAVVLLIY